MEKPDALSTSEYEFFLVVTPGLEDLSVRDVSRLGLEVDTEITRGGVSLRLPLRDGFELNRVLKTPNRILVRVAEFGCRDFPKLFKKISRFQWDQWVGNDVRLVFHATSHASRLKMKKRIEQTCQDGRREFLKKRESAPSLRQAEIYVRFLNDVCTLSFDLSGELLYKRGWRPLVSEAPLRETVAASLLFMLEGRSVSTEIELVDPMTGGGTFLLEAARLREPVTSRPFAYEILKPYVENAVPPTALADRTPSPYQGFVGYESDPKVLAAAQENLRSFVGRTSLQLIAQDFFSTAPLSPHPNRWVICNPPYGERIKIQGRLSDYYDRLLAQIERIAHPSRVCILIPEKARPRHLKAPTNWRFMESRRFQNGGLPVQALLYERRVAPDITH